MEVQNEITLCNKQSADAFRVQNALFLAEHNTDDKQIDYYTDLAMKIYEEFDIDGSFTVKGVRKNVKTWYENKRAQMELFRKHPYWSEKHKAIVFSQTETRGIDYSLAYRKLDYLCDYVRHMIRAKYDSDMDENYYAAFRTFYLVLDWCVGHGEEQIPTLSAKFIEVYKKNCRVPDRYGKTLTEGAKITRVIRKWFSQVLTSGGKVIDATTFVDEGDARTRPSFEKYYAEFADALSELTIEKITLASLHFCDFMTMSNGNSWSSCHFINSHNIFHDGSANSYSGAYKQGCMSYALDEPSFILYTLPSNYEGDEYYRVQKLNRMCCQYSNGILVTGKAYPLNSDYLIQRYRQMMQLIISQTEEVPNRWTFSRKTEKIASFVRTADGASHYPDYLKSGQKPTISMCSHFAIDIEHMLTIGHKAYCLHCGKDLSGSGAEWLQCSEHRKKMVCSVCGKRLDPNKKHKSYDGKYVCDDCVFYCAYHKEYEPVSLKRNITTADGEITICERAMSEYFLCRSCGKYHPMSHAAETDDGSEICKRCASSYPVCAICKRVIIGPVHNHKGKPVCNSCKDVSSGKLIIRKENKYNVGDYVLIKAEFQCIHGASFEMEECYPGRIVRVTVNRDNGQVMYFSKIDGGIRNWTWDSGCIEGKVIGATDSMIGKTLVEANKMLKEAFK